MTAEELRADNRFLIEQLKETIEENRRLKEDISEIKQELKDANRRADEESAGRKRLFDKLEKFMDGQKSNSDKYKELERKYETLQGRYDLLCAAYYGGSKTCSDKYSGQKNEGINDGRDDFDGTEGSLPAGTPGPIGSDAKHKAGDSEEENTSVESANDSDESEQQTCYHGPDRTGARYKKETIGEQEAKKLGYKIVDFFLAQIKKLYKREKLYASNPDYYTPERIKEARNDEYTNDIVNSMHVRLLEMIAKGEHYSTFISTCQQKCRSFRDFFVDYVRAWNQGRRDFDRSSSARLLPKGRKNLIRLAFAPGA